MFHGPPGCPGSNGSELPTDPKIPMVIKTYSILMLTSKVLEWADLHTDGSKVTCMYVYVYKFFVEKTVSMKRKVA